MARTFGDLTTEALHDDFDSTRYTAKAQQAINDCLRDIARRVDLPSQQKTYTVSLVDGTGSYAVPSDFARLKSLTDNNENPLTQIMRDELDFYDLTDTGDPYLYCLYGSSLTLYPTPTASNVTSLTLRYRAAPVDGFTNTTDTVDTYFPDAYAHILVKGARSRLYAFEDDAQMADYWETQYERALARLKGDLQNQEGSRKRQVGDNRRRSNWSPW